MYESYQKEDNSPTSRPKPLLQLSGKFNNLLVILDKFLLIYSIEWPKTSQNLVIVFKLQSKLRMHLMRPVLSCLKMVASSNIEILPGNVW